MNTTQEKERLKEEKSKLEKRLSETEAALNECKEYIEMLQKKAREDRRTRAKAAIELSENIALERENLVRQLDTLKLVGEFSNFLRFCNGAKFRAVDKSNINPMHLVSQIT